MKIITLKLEVPDEVTRLVANEAGSVFAFTTKSEHLPLLVWEKKNYAVVVQMKLGRKKKR